MKALNYLIIVLTMLATAGMTFDALDKSAILIGLVFIGWGISPYILLLVLNKMARRVKAKVVVLVSSIINAALGLAVIIDAMYIHPDAQGGLVFIFIPFYQWVLAIFSLLPFSLLNRKVQDRPA